MKALLPAAVIVGAMTASVSAWAQAALPPIEQTPETPQACTGMLEKSKTALSKATLNDEQKAIVDRAIRWGELWRGQADGGLGAPGYRRCMISLRPAEVLLKIQ